MVINELVAQRPRSWLRVGAETLRCAQGDSFTRCHAERSEASRTMRHYSLNGHKTLACGV